MLKIAVATPIPTARVRTQMAVKAGARRSLWSERRIRAKVSIVPPTTYRRQAGGGAAAQPVQLGKGGVCSFVLLPCCAPPPGVCRPKTFNTFEVYDYVTELGRELGLGWRRPRRRRWTALL